MHSQEQQLFPDTSNQNLDLAAQFVSLTYIRKKILREQVESLNGYSLCRRPRLLTHDLRFVKHLHTTDLPWLLPDSEFAQLRRDMLHWYVSLPPSISLTRSAIYMRKETNQHGALILLHITYHQSMVNLMRISIPDHFRMQSSLVFPDEQHEFLRMLQDACFDSSIAVSDAFREALGNGPESLADMWLCVAAHGSAWCHCTLRV